MERRGKGGGGGIGMGKKEEGEEWSEGGGEEVK